MRGLRYLKGEGEFDLILKSIRLGGVGVGEEGVDDSFGIQLKKTRNEKVLCQEQLGLKLKS